MNDSSKNAKGSVAIAKKFESNKDTTYTRWIAKEGLDIIDAMYVLNLHTVDLKPWARRGGRGVYLNHDASWISTDCYVCEISPGKQLAPQRQLYEEMIYILDGRGSTIVWNDAGVKVSFEWKAGAIFAIPRNAWHQHFNGSGNGPARFVSVTNAPVIINAFGDIALVFNTHYDFNNRFSGESDYFAHKGEQKGLLLDTNFVADVINLPLIFARERGAGGGHIRFSLVDGCMSSHISQFPVGTYKKAHAHGPGEHVIVLSGEGYSLMGPEGEEPRRFDWEEGAMFVPPNMWFHQHFNTGSTPARYLAFKAEGVAMSNSQGLPRSWISRRIGGHQVDYADEAPQVRQTFSDALAKVGLKPRMDEVYQAELLELPPANLSRGAWVRESTHE
jgi:oxalate decarboxylase/phosphoglucose isomerase-like protein (cupin superfamily)